MVGRDKLPPSFPLDTARIELIDRLCDEYEREWKAAAAPGIEAYLARVEPELRGWLIRELLLIDVEYRRRHGEHVSLDEYRRRFPQYSEQLDVASANLADHACGDTQSEQGIRRSAVTDGADADPQRTIGRERGSSQLHCVGRYRIERVLGEGGFGTVYLAWDPRLDRHVALKVLPRTRPGSTPQFEMYLQEARAAAQLDHPHIVPVHDVGQSDQGDCFIVSKFIEGYDLATRLTRKPCSVVEAVEMTACLADALHHAHTHGLVHRDVKPANILIDDSGHPYLADFGLALRDDRIGQGPEMVGTPSYMSPEQVSGQGHRVDGRADIFSLGVVLYELLTGTRPFRSDSRLELMEQIRHMEAKPPRQLNDSLPPELERVCLTALAKHVNDRYSTAKDFARDLRGSLSGISGSENAAGARPDTGSGKPVPRWGAWALAGVLLCVTVLVLVTRPWESTRGLSDVPAPRTDADSRRTVDPDSLPIVAQDPLVDSSAATSPIVAGPSPVEEFLVAASRDQGPFESVEQRAPLRQGDHIRFSVRLREPVHVRLVWIDATGQPQELYPLDPELGHRGDDAVTVVESPVQLDRGWPWEGDGGIETAVLLASRESLAPLVLDEFRTEPATGPPRRAVKRFDATRTERAERRPGDQDRALGTISQPVEDAVLRLLERLRPHADVVQAVVIPCLAPAP